MSLTVALNTAVSGLFANQQAVAATSENIANLNTADFTRREATFYTDAIPDQFAGVNVDIARAATDRFLQGAGYRSGAAAAGALVVSEALSRVEASLGAPGENISYANALDEAFAALTAAAANPSSLAARADALAALENAFAAFARTQGAIDLEIEAGGARLQTDVDRVNALLADINRLNAVAPESPGAGDLIDARLTELSTLISITVSRNDSGQVTVAAANGAALASAGGYMALGVTAGALPRLTLSTVDPATGAQALANSDAGGLFPSGEIAGLLKLLGDDLTELARLVAGRAGAVAGEMNAAYAQNSVVGALAPTSDTLIVSDIAGRFSVNAAIMGDPARFAIARPSSGFPAGLNDGAGANALSAIGAGVAARETTQSVALIGSSARNADLSARTTGALAADLSARIASESGVNLDEELSNLILYQRAYGANARVIAAVDELWQTLLNVI